MQAWRRKRTEAAKPTQFNLSSKNGVGVSYAVFFMLGVHGNLAYPLLLKSHQLPRQFWRGKCVNKKIRAFVGGALPNQRVFVCAKALFFGFLFPQARA